MPMAALLLPRLPVAQHGASPASRRLPDAAPVCQADKPQLIFQVPPELPLQTFSSYFLVLLSKEDTRRPKELMNIAWRVEFSVT